MPLSSPVNNPQYLKMSYQEFLVWSDEDTHAEWVNGQVIVISCHTALHQEMAGFLLELLGLFVQFFHLGRMTMAPFEMKLAPDGPSREPDILFVANEHLDRLTAERLQGPADLVIEIVSDDSVTRDRVDKFDEYEEFGVREYWIIDPRPNHQRAAFYVRDERGQFQSVAPDDKNIYRSTVVAGFWLRVDWLWAEELPSALFALAEVAGLPADVVTTLRAISESQAPSAPAQ